MDVKEGEILIKLAREAIKSVFDDTELKIDEDIRKKFGEKRGVFVTIKSFPEKRLRGCIGFPYPVYPLYLAVIESAISAAFEDPRFPPLRKEEIKNIIIELSILTIPEKIEYNSLEDLKKQIKIGKDGLIAKRGFRSGLLLPQVPVEEEWDVETFIRYTCLKAGLEENCWEYDTEFYKFSAEIFEEIEPEGKVIRKEL